MEQHFSIFQDFDLHELLYLGKLTWVLAHVFGVWVQKLFDDGGCEVVDGFMKFIAKKSKSRTLSSQEVLIEQGQFPTYLVFVKRGIIKLIRYFHFQNHSDISIKFKPTPYHPLHAQKSSLTLPTSSPKYLRPPPRKSVKLRMEVNTLRPGDVSHLIRNSFSDLCHFGILSNWCSDTPNMRFWRRRYGIE